MKRHLIAVAVIFAGLAAVTTAPANAAITTPASQSTKMFTIGNMTCPTCPITVKTAMSRVAGVKTVKIDLAAKTATVTFDPSVVTTAKIAAASSNVGFPARLSS
jgi:mercuric ion binding protein